MDFFLFVLKWMDFLLFMVKYVFVLVLIILVVIGYMDLGNWVCVIEGGFRFGFEFLWVVIFFNCMVVFF